MLAAYEWLSCRVSVRVSGGRGSSGACIVRGLQVAGTAGDGLLGFVLRDDHGDAVHGYLQQPYLVTRCVNFIVNVFF